MARKIFVSGCTSPDRTDLVCWPMWTAASPPSGPRLIFAVAFSVATVTTPHPTLAADVHVKDRHCRSENDSSVCYWDQNWRLTWTACRIYSDCIYCNLFKMTGQTASMGLTLKEPFSVELNNAAAQRIKKHADLNTTQESNYYSMTRTSRNHYTSDPPWSINTDKPEYAASEVVSVSKSPNLKILIQHDLSVPALRGVES